jgi:hypothetical protein
MTWTESGWLMSVVPHQPHFPGMPADTFTLWGYGLLIDSDGDYVTLEQTGPPPGYRIGISAGQGYRTSSPVTARPSSIRWISDALKNREDLGVAVPAARPAGEFPEVTY